MYIGPLLVHDMINIFRLKCFLLIYNIVIILYIEETLKTDGEEERKRGGEEEEGRRRKGKEEMWLPHALPRRLARTWPRPATGAQAGG